MYDEHFGLTGRPFQLTPDPAFWYETETHRRAMAYLGYGLAQGEGFIVITGDIGAGKTTLVGHLLDTLDRDALNPIKIVSTAIEADDLLRVIATQLGVAPAGLKKAELLIAIERGLHAVARTGRRTLLVVDEAQALPVDSLEELRMLSNFQAGGHALIQIVLLGQPEFRDRLAGSDRLEQLRQRIIAIHHLDPMSADEVAPYVHHRLNVVGWSGRPAFSESAMAALHHATDGVPRRLNQLANRVMLHAAVERLDRIDGAAVATVADDLLADLPLGAPVMPRAAMPAPARVEAAMPEVATPASPPAEPAAPPPPSVVAPPAVDERAPARPGAPSRTPAWMDVDLNKPVRLLADPAADAPTPAAPAPEPVPAREPDADVAATVSTDRLAALEARIDEQDKALRRVLTLLVDWVENDAAPRHLDGVPARGAAA